jgi:hypothetical protein
VALSGVWNPTDLELPGGIGLPLGMVVDDGAEPHPRLTGRYRVDDLNTLLREEFGEELSSEEEWFLGHYDLSYRLTFHNFHLRSATNAWPDPVVRHELLFDGTGEVRIKFEENLLDISVSGRVKELSGRIILEPIRDDDGVGLLYAVDVTDLDVSIDNLAPWGESRISSVLRRSLDKSLNRKRKRERAARKRFPDWVPLDTAVDIRLVSEPEGGPD